MTHKTKKNQNTAMENVSKEVTRISDEHKISKLVEDSKKLIDTLELDKSTADLIKQQFDYNGEMSLLIIEKM